MTSEEDWRRWFEAYARFLLHDAELAECEGLDMLSVGCELKAATREREADWRVLLGRVREIYHGRLTYSANWDEVFDVPFWDALDAIGVNAYFPLEAPTPAAWAPWVSRLAELARRSGRPVVLTELGYPASADCTRKPLEDPERAGGTEGEACQARALDAALAALWREPWVAGVFAWKWFPDPRRADDGRAFDLNGRAGAEVLRRRFRPRPGERR